MTPEDLGKQAASLSFRTSSGKGFSECRVVAVRRICPGCGEWKDAAIDVCWDRYSLAYFDRVVEHVLRGGTLDIQGCLPVGADAGTDD